MVFTRGESWNVKRLLECAEKSVRLIHSNSEGNNYNVRCLDVLTLVDILLNDSELHIKLLEEYQKKFKRLCFDDVSCHQRVVLWDRME